MNDRRPLSTVIVRSGRGPGGSRGRSRRVRRRLAALIALCCLLSAGGAGAQAPSVTGRKCTRGRAGPYTCRAVDLLSFTATAELGGGRVSDIWGWRDKETRHEYALLGSTEGLQIVDITNPTDPVYLGAIPKPGNGIWQDVEVYEDHAFVVCDVSPCGMQVFDLTRLRRIDQQQSWTPDFVYPVTPLAHTIDINRETGFAYLNGTPFGGSHVLDVSDPTAPVFAGAIRDDGYTHDSHCRVYRGDDEGFAGKEICFSANEDTITIYDVTDKSAPRRLARVTYEGATYTHQAWLTKDHNHIVVSDELDEGRLGVPSTTYVFDVSELESPRLVSSYRAKTMATDHNNYVLGDHVFQANYKAGLRILDASNVANGKLREVGFFDILPEDDDSGLFGAWAAYPYLPSGNVIVSGIEQGLFVLRPTLAS